MYEYLLCIFIGHSMRTIIHGRCESDFVTWPQKAGNSRGSFHFKHFLERANGSKKLKARVSFRYVQHILLRALFTAPFLLFPSSRKQFKKSIYGSVSLFLIYIGICIVTFS